MKKTSLFILLLFTFLSCKKEEKLQLDSQTLEINNFIWKAMNAYYLWKDQKNILHDDYFASQEDLNSFLDTYSDPEVLFEDLIYDREHTDRWSWIVDDYEALIQYFKGVRKTTGMRVGFVYEPGSTQYVFAYVRYVLSDSDAFDKGIKRGDIFRKINGQRLTKDNYIDLISNDVLNIELAQWSGNDLVDTGNVISLTKSIENESPIHIASTFSYNGKKIGYLMYNGFTYDYNWNLNNVMINFAGENIDELIIDLRYNPGGSVATMQYLASMITGQFTNEVFLNYQWHPQLQAWMQERYPNSLYRTFVDQMNNGEAIQHLYLNKVYVITTQSSASASESLINCLKPYIDVIQFGTRTHGKYTASVTLFDSPDFSSKNINPNHKWALQPIVLKISNAQGVSDFADGLAPDFLQAEDYQNLGVLGDPAEPLLHTVLEYISGNSPLPMRTSYTNQELYYLEQAYQDNQYIGELPELP